MPEPALGSPPQGQGQTGRQRLWRAFMKPSATQFIVAGLLLVLGMSAVVQVRANELDDTYAGYREQDLIDVLTGLTGASQRAESQLAELERSLRELRTTSGRREVALDRARDSIDTYSILAGLSPVTGPGLTITIGDGAGTAALDTMVDMLQELRNAGAEAMAINGEVRVVAETSVEQGVGGLRFGGQQLSPPYLVEVIGDPTTLRSGMTFRRGPVEQLEEDGATVDVTEARRVEITVVADADEPEHATSPE